MKLSSLICLISLVGCATAQVTGYRAPDSEEEPYRHVVVYYAVTDLGLRAKVEREIVWRLTRVGCNAKTLLEVIPPTEEIVPSKLNAKLKKAGFDSLLTITESSASVDSTYVPGYWNGTYFQPGYVSKSLLAKGNVSFIDVKTNKTVWIGTVDGSGAYSDVVIGTMVRVLVSRLALDGVIYTGALPEDSASSSLQQTRD